MFAAHVVDPNHTGDALEMIGHGRGGRSEIEPVVGEAEPKVEISIHMETMRRFDFRLQRILLTEVPKIAPENIAVLRFENIARHRILGNAGGTPAIVAV